MRFTLSVLPEIDTTTFGRRLKKARLEVGLAQQGVADLLGAHVQYISNRRNGLRRPRRLSIEQIEEVMTSAEQCCGVRMNRAATMEWDEESAEAMVQLRRFSASGYCEPSCGLDKLWRTIHAGAS